MADKFHQWSDWTADYSPAPYFDREAFQKRIDAICGTYHGTSIVKVFWGGEEEEEQIASVSLTGLQDIQKRGKFMTRVRGVKGKVRIRRWLFSDYQPPEQMQEVGFAQMPGGGIFLPKTLIKEKQTGKYLSPAMRAAADHSKCDPEVCNSLEFYCFGAYREPNQTDLDEMIRARYKIAQGPQVRPDQPMSQKQVNLFNKQIDDQIDAENAPLQ